MYTFLREFDAEAHAELLEASTSQSIRRARVQTPNGRHVTIQWTTKAVNSRRLNFDDWLFQKACANEMVLHRCGASVKKMVREKEKWTIEVGNEQFTARWLLGAGGAHCPVARQLAHKRIDRNHHLAAIRTYWEQLPALDPQTNEFYASKSIAPGYAWIFPLPNGGANVGLGMLSRDAVRKGINLKKALDDFLSEGAMGERFGQAVMRGKQNGFDLPLGSKVPVLGGEGWIICGDAASLIDPLDGHGIGSAMWSGFLAVECISDIEKGSSVERAHSAYRRALDHRFYRKFRFHRFLISAFRYPQLLNVISIPPLLNMAGFRIVRS